MISIQLLSFVSPCPDSKLGSGCQYHPRKEGDVGCRPNGILLLPRWATRSCVPFGWAAPKHPWGAAPRGPRLPGGGPHFSREMGRKRAGGKPPGPPVLWPARSRSLVLGIVVFGTIVGLFPPVCQDRFGTHFRGKICWKACL